MRRRRVLLAVVVSHAIVVGCSGQAADHQDGAASRSDVSGVMVVRQPAGMTVAPGEGCADVVVERELSMLPDDGAAVAADLDAGTWEPDPDLQDVLVCRVSFSVTVPRSQEYRVSVDGSEPLVFSDSEFVDGIELFDPSQFFDPDSYRETSAG